ncbi:MAG: beta galactosidase jelly roll domain-containing protein [Melioribacteraceae bacterium]|nr:beta galactosidase jelly roll domain-containing protein [Melioribacteraceae bacterium]
MLNFKLLLLWFCTISLSGQQIHLQNVHNRNIISLNGYWKIIIDPYENGFYDYRYQENPNGYFKNKKPASESDLVEYDFDRSDSLYVPRDWNTQNEKLFMYEGTVWYKKSFDLKISEGKRYLINFGAVNYNAVVYVNGDKIGEHTGGFTQFTFEITKYLKGEKNFVVVKVDNKRLREGVPTLNTDWWNYGGITRDVSVIIVPETFVQDYFIQLAENESNTIKGWIKLNGNNTGIPVKLSIPEINLNETLTENDNGIFNFEFNANPKLWDTENPYLYKVKIIGGQDTTTDRIGFRNIETEGSTILLNGKPVFLKGISSHEESPITNGRAATEDDALAVLEVVKELGCNYIRLAHYPHNENIIRAAEKSGILIWSEIPVYWTILWNNSQTYSNAENQLTEMISRDKNRANVIIWSVANETPRSDSRLKFLRGLIDKARALDPTRLISAATELSYDENKMIIDDPLCEILDIIGANEYLGWYGGKPEDAQKISWVSKFNKPLIISEFGGGALYGFHADKNTRWSEEYQENVYINQLIMLDKIPFLQGMSPWILMDFRSPRRPLPGIQDFWNRKGLVSPEGNKKKAFYILEQYYKSKKTWRNNDFGN